VGGDCAPPVAGSDPGNLLHPSGSSSDGRERCSHRRALPHAAAVAFPFSDALVIVWRIHHHLVGLIDPHEMHPSTVSTNGSGTVAHPAPLTSSRAEHGGAGRLVVHRCGVIDPHTFPYLPRTRNPQKVSTATKNQTHPISNANGSNPPNGSNRYRTTGQPYLTWRAGGEGILAEFV
jgi:hypothetical protein